MRAVIEMPTRAKHMSIQMVPLTAILPNPYRHIENYKLSESKLEMLIQSYDNSGFWDGSIQARPSPKYENKFEIAFGHHRVAAARQASIKELGLVVSKRSNADMLRMMADENREEFRADALVGVETVRAVIEAYAKGEIELEAVADDHVSKGQIYHLPGGKRYTLGTVARFLNWVKPSDGQATRACRLAFDAFREEASTAEALASIPSQHRSERAIEVVTTAARAARVEAERSNLAPAKVRQAEKLAATQAAKEVKDNSGYRSRDIAVDIGKSAAKQVKEKKPKKLPAVEVYIERIIRNSERILPFAEILRDCNRLYPYIKDLDLYWRERLADALSDMLKRSTVSIKPLVEALREGDVKELQNLLGE